MWLFNLLFSSLSQLYYVEVRISRSVSVSPLEFEITRVDCNYILVIYSVIKEVLFCVIAVCHFSNKKKKNPKNLLFHLYSSALAGLGSVIVMGS